MENESKSDTPETEAECAAKGGGPLCPCEYVHADFARKLERERDEARFLCRWAFPRLRAMCHDFDATGTGWCCAEEMESHPEIFSSENSTAQLPPRSGPNSKQDASGG